MAPPRCASGSGGCDCRRVPRGAIHQASGELVFAAKQPGVYAIYCPPYLSNGRSNYPTVNHATPKDGADLTWAKKSAAMPAKTKAIGA